MLSLSRKHNLKALSPTPNARPERHGNTQNALPPVLPRSPRRALRFGGQKSKESRSRRGLEPFPVSVLSVDDEPVNQEVIRSVFEGIKGCTQEHGPRGAPRR